MKPPNGLPPRFYTSNTICMIVLAVALLVIAGLSGCSSMSQDRRGTALDTVTDAAAVVVLLEAYRDAKTAITDQLDTLPPDTAYALIELESQIDQLVIDYESVWQQPTSPMFIDNIIARTSLLYSTGKALIHPHVATMSVDNQMKLRRLDATWTRTEAAYQRWKADPVVNDRTALIESGIDFATALILILGA